MPANLLSDASDLGLVDTYRPRPRLSGQSRSPTLITGKLFAGDDTPKCSSHLDRVLKTVVTIGRQRFFEPSVDTRRDIDFGAQRRKRAVAHLQAKLTKGLGLEWNLVGEHLIAQDP